MCGIIAFISQNQECIQYLLNGLTILQNRGYDSAGICTINDNNQFINTKFASTQSYTSIEKLKENEDKHKNHKIGIAHTRWATHGPKTDYNAHPHIDFHNKLALVHNGIIENYKEIKQKLINHGYTFKSDTDTEVIANLISYHLEKYNKLDAIKHSMNELQGTWGVIIIFNDEPNHLYICKNGSPLLVTYNDNFAIVASESSAFSQYSNQYITLKDNEIIRLGINKYEHLIDYEMKKIENVEEIKLSPDPYPHWMLKEISEQDNIVLRAMNMGGRILDDYNIKLGGLLNHRDELLRIDNLIIIASGTSYHAGLLGAKYFRYLKCFNTVNVIDSAEFVSSDIPMRNAGILVISQSGETKDLHMALETAKANNCFVMGVVNVVGSLIARESDCGIYLNAGREVAVASTKAFTSQVVVLLLISLWFSQHKDDNLRNKRGQIISDLRNLSINFKTLIQNMSKIITNELIDYLSKMEHMFILGRGNAYPIACEGALKIKEIAYLHAEGYAGGALKHGPFALIEEGMPIVLIILDDEYQDKMKSACEEVKARGAYTIVITDIEDYSKEDCDYLIHIPNDGYLTSILSVVPIQYISYKIALKKGHNPDFPKNLSKTITVL
jgi:glucosamine--fructose-6-phosphate aminotransferase (isomerizing)